MKNRKYKRQEVGTKLISYESSNIQVDAVRYTKGSIVIDKVHTYINNLGR